jgi:hypothetical protein
MPNVTMLAMTMNQPKKGFLADMGGTNLCLYHLA